MATITSRWLQKTWRVLSRSIGPGFVTGAADDDPSGIGTYSQTGAIFGLSQLWFAPYALPLMIAVQEACGRIGLVTGKGLAGVLRKHYRRRTLMLVVSLLLLANIINIGADLSAMSAALQLIMPIPETAGILLMTGLTLGLELFVSYRTYAKVLKYLALALVAYIVTALLVVQDWAAVFWATVFPSFSWSRTYLMNLTALLGTTISPYLFFWQAGEEVEEELANKDIRRFGEKPHTLPKRELRRFRLDTVVGMSFSNIVTFFIILVTGITLGKAGLGEVQTAADAAQALVPLAGHFAGLLFTIGILGAGLLGVPVLAGSAAYALSEVFGWREGLSQSVMRAKAFYGVIAVSTLAGLAIAMTGFSPFKLLYWSAVFNGMVAPILLFMIWRIGRSSEIMGKFTSSSWSSAGVLLTAVIMALAALAFLVS